MPIVRLAAETVNLFASTGEHTSGGGPCKRCRDVTCLQHRVILAEVQKALGEAQKRAARSASQGQVYSYIHMGGKIGVMIEVNCETGEVKILKMWDAHDIGKAIDHEVEGPHALIGAKLAKKYGESPSVVHAISAHHEDVPPASVLAALVQAADTLSGARPGARREILETYVKRLEELEKVAKSFTGISKSYAIQAGRELRIIVESETISDAEAILLSRDIAKKIEESMSYPGQIKVTVIRETRAVEYAK